MRCIVCDLVTEDIDHKFFVNLEFWFVVGDKIRHFIYENSPQKKGSHLERSDL